jgi:hypothetical protein
MNTQGLKAFSDSLKEVWALSNKTPYLGEEVIRAKKVDEEAKG